MITEKTSSFIMFHDNNTVSHHICGVYLCEGERGDTVYSELHLSHLGWKKVKLSYEAKYAFGHEFMFYCPECAKKFEWKK